MKEYFLKTCQLLLSRCWCHHLDFSWLSWINLIPSLCMRNAKNLLEETLKTHLKGSF